MFEKFFKKQKSFHEVIAEAHEYIRDPKNKGYTILFESKGISRLTIQKTLENDEVTFYCGGELDFTTTFSLLNVMVDYMLEFDDRHSIILDFSKIDTMNQLGFKILCDVLEDLKDRNWKFIIKNPNPLVEMQLDMSQFAENIRIEEPENIPNPIKPLQIDKSKLNDEEITIFKHVVGTSIRRRGKNIESNILDIAKGVKNGRITYYLMGKIEYATSWPFETIVQYMLKHDDFQDVIFDFTKVPYITSVGIRIIFTVQAGVEKIPGRKFIILNPNEAIMGLFKKLNITSSLTIEKTI